MKSCYFDAKTRSIADVCEYDGEYGVIGKRKSYLITRISVLPKSRRQGIGQRLLSEIIADADKDGVVLYLEIVPGDEDTKYEQLHMWYKNNGFKDCGIAIMKRKPVSTTVA